jgi:hypothetical protein
MRTLLIVLLAVVSFGFAARAGDPDNKNPETEIILAMQAAVRADDKQWFVDHLHLPVRYYGATKETITSKDWFLKHYATIIGPELKQAILTQDPQTYFKNYQGLMVGQGSRNIWLDDFGDPGAGVPSNYQIITINNSK